MAGTVLLPLCLLLLLQGGLPEAPGPAARTGPVLQRLRMLEEQFRRFREVTLSHLQSIARNYNISYNIDRRFQVLAEQAEAADAARAVLGAELSRLAAAGRRLHRRVKRLEGTVGALTPRHRLLARPEAGAEPHSLWDTVRSQHEPRGPAPPSTASPRPLKVKQRLREEGHRLLVETGTTGMPMQDAEPLRDAQAVTAPLSATATGPQEQPGTACNVGSVLLFPSASVGNAAVLRPGLRAGLWALSLCTWVLTPAPRLGTVLNYASEDGDSELAVHGQDGDPGSARFVIGDTAFRELPVTPLLDGKWHHLCLIWSSGRGQYRFYVDRRLLAAGSGFQRGYEIPAGGSLVLGQLQGHVRAGFSPTGAFVGRLAGLAVWSRALVPGEVASMATGQGLPRRPLLTLANATLQGEVQRVACPCLEHCP
ncbi:pentraxin-4 [Oxyura jamaicensis]|uniref:pentraxin-4 n=1 Tax=Oxyura jamaicensis TaxID=8884 RepID=UPI0015A5407C|nr:pentraxin-4 [Oxyura jamaicensis]